MSMAKSPLLSQVTAAFYRVIYEPQTPNGRDCETVDSTRDRREAIVKLSITTAITISLIHSFIYSHSIAGYKPMIHKLHTYYNKIQIK